MKGLSVVILSYTNCNEINQMNEQCVASLLTSENFDTKYNLEIIAVESNKNFLIDGYNFPQPTKLIIPTEPFNFNKYLNIGLSHCSHQYVAFCNNDLLFGKNWFSEMLEVEKTDSNIKSFCPTDLNEDVDLTVKYSLGYDVRKHIKGWCIVAKKELFKTIGPFDETFDFYYSDDDYAMTLRKHKIKNALVHKSVVQHLGGINTSVVKKEGNNDFNKITSKYKNLPKYLFTDDYKWLLKNEKTLDGHLKFHKKWGSRRWIGIKNRLQKIWQ